MALNYIDYADDENDEVPNNYDYALHLNSYLPTYNISETDTDEQTPMLSRHSKTNGTPSEMNQSIAALPEMDNKIRRLTPSAPSSASGGGVVGGGGGGASVPAPPSSNGNTSDNDNLCELVDSEDENCDNTRFKSSVGPRVTRV